MRLVDGRFVCIACGVKLDIPLDLAPRVQLIAESGEPNIRSLSFEGREIHRCDVSAAAQHATLEDWDARTGSRTTR